MQGLTGTKLIYSQWPGHLDRGRLLEWCKGRGIRAQPLQHPLIVMSGV
jgi:hypothetical protein